MVAHCIPVMIGQLELGLCVRDRVWGLGLAPAQWCVPVVGHDIVVVVWCGNHGGLIYSLFKSRLCSGSWELVSDGFGWVSVVDQVTAV
jgi:hypothetical protein